MIQSDFKFCEQVDPYEYLQGFTYVVEMNRFKWDSRATADKVKMILNGALCSVEGCTGEPFKINETENEVYCEKHWRTLQRDLEGVFTKIQDACEDIEVVFIALEKELIYKIIIELKIDFDGLFSFNKSKMSLSHNRHIIVPHFD